MTAEMNAQCQYFFMYDEPVPYKNLVLYPITMREYIPFFTYVDCLMINKNVIPDVKIITMSYLDYLFYKSDKEIDTEKITLAKLCEILKLSLRITNEQIQYYQNENGKYELLLNNEKIDANDFDIIKDIICLQNNIELPDENIHPDLKKALDEAQDYYNEIHSSGKVGTLEDQMICVSISTSYKFEDIYNLTIRKFTKILQRVDFKLHYQIYKTAEMGGMVTFKKPIENWTNNLSRTFEEKYENVMVDSEGFTAKVNMSDLKSK